MSEQEHEVALRSLRTVFNLGGHADALASKISSLESKIAEQDKIIARWNSPGPTPEEQSLDPEVVRQELRDLGVDDEEQRQIVLRGRVFVRALVANQELRAKISELEKENDELADSLRRQGEP